MRIDEINLLGKFKITGNTGNNSQAIGMSGGSTSFIDVIASGGGSSEGLVKRSGYNYVIVEATGDDIANGNKLRTAYNDAVTLLGQIGTPAVDNRVSILLTPGDYDLNGLLEISVSYIDIVGISQNPLDTIVRASDDLTTFSFPNSGLDFGLYNIDIRSGGTGQQVIFSDSGSGSTYLRMKNLIISGNGFGDGDTFYSFYDLDGEFEDITVLDGCYFALAYNSLSGTYKNIKIGDVAYAFYTTSITGTYKNITISNLSANAFGCSNISGSFENIKKLDGTGNIFIFDNLSGGYYKNIIISGSPALVFYGGQNAGVFEDIEISSATNVFESPSSSIDGTFKNIKIGDVTVGSSFRSGGGNISGTFSNIEVGNVTNNAFYANNSLSINIKDIKIGNVSGDVFVTGSGDITGTYENITMGDVTGNCFYPDSNISGTFDTIRVGNVGSNFFCGGSISGTFKNIKANDLTTCFYGNLSGNYKNISINNTNSNIFVGYTIDGTFDHISVVNSSSNYFYAGSVLFGTFSNIKVDSTSGAFISDDTLGGYYDDITIGTSLGPVFYSGTSPVQGTFKNIKVTSCYGFLESSASIQPILVENIEVGDCTAGNFIATVGGSLGGTYKNVKVNSVAVRSFRGDSGITGTYSNIEIGYSGAEVFLTSNCDIEVNVDSLFVGYTTNIFNAGSADVTSNSKFNKLDVTGNCFGFNLNGVKFIAKLTNSRINMIGIDDGIFSNGGTIERSKILTNNTTGGYSLTGTGQVIYTMTNQSNTVVGATQNIEDASITS